MVRCVVTTGCPHDLDESNQMGGAVSFINFKKAAGNEVFVNEAHPLAVRPSFDARATAAAKNP